MKIVYALVDPRDNVTFYIGMGSPSRPKEHLKLEHSDNNETKKARIRDIQQAGFEPIICVLHKGLTVDEASNLERYYIGLHKRLFEGGTLTNISAGGQIGGWGDARSNPEHAEFLKQKCAERNKQDSQKQKVIVAYRRNYGARRSPALELQSKYWYHSPFGCFVTVQTEDILGFSIQCCTASRCDQKITKQSYGQSKMLKSCFTPDQCVGKTYREMGFYPVPR